MVACVSDDPDADAAHDIDDWPTEITAASPLSFHLIAEVGGEPVGAIQIYDPHLESTHYWGDIERGLRAVDIWIGPPERLGRGYGTEMMRRAIALCFDDETVSAVIIDPLNSNTAVHRFYQRLGFEVIGRQMFDEDDCLVHRLERDAWNVEAGAS